MKKSILLMILVLSGISLISSGCSRHLRAASNNHKADKNTENKGDDDADYAVREEITQNYTFAPDANVGVYGINGSVDVTTSDSTKAEIHILRLAHSKEVLENKKTIITFENNSLNIEGNRRKNSGIWDLVTGNDDMRVRVTLKLPRNIEIETSGINGRVNLGEIDGRVSAHGVNGKITIAKASGSTEFSGVNGKIEATIAKLNKDGISIHGVNGNIDLKFLDEVNANIEAHGLNGRINAELPNVQVKEQKHSNFSAVVGNGGPNIEVNGTNGNVWLSSAKNKVSATPKSEVKGS
jgi:hypothetical protein